MCFACGDISNTPQEVLITVNLVQAIAAIPVLGLVMWQAKSLVAAVRSLASTLRTEGWS